MAQKERNANCLTARIVFAVIGAISGVSIFVSFAVLKNINAAAWGLLSTVFAVTVLRLHLAHRKDTFLAVFSQKTVRLLKQFGAFGSFASIVAAVTYCTLAVVLKQGYKVKNDGYMPACIFALMTLKWTAFLYCHSNYYEKLYFPDSEIKPIAKDERTTKAAI